MTINANSQSASNNNDEGSVTINPKTITSWLKAAGSNEFVLLQTVVRPRRVPQAPITPAPVASPHNEIASLLKGGLKTGSALAGIIAIPIVSVSLAAAGCSDAAFAVLAWGGIIAGLLCLRARL